jgi:hypothetical protein
VNPGTVRKRGNNADVGKNINKMPPAKNRPIGFLIDAISAKTASDEFCEILH